MAISEDRVRVLIQRDAERVMVTPELRQRIDTRLRSPSAVRVRTLVVATAAVIVVLVGIAASVIAGDSLLRPVRPSSSATDVSTSSSMLPVPSNLHITPPEPGLPRELATYVGTWEGIW